MSSIANQIKNDGEINIQQKSIAKSLPQTTDAFTSVDIWTADEDCYFMPDNQNSNGWSQPVYIDSLLIQDNTRYPTLSVNALKRLDSQIFFGNPSSSSGNLRYPFNVFFIKKGETIKSRVQTNNSAVNATFVFYKILK